jgi:opacity protein-like surface antigen
MPRFVLAAIAVLMLSSPFAFAQNSTPKVQVFGGYSFFQASTSGLGDPELDFTLKASIDTLGVTTGFHGWTAAAQYNVNGALGFVADVNGRYGPPLAASSTSGISGLPNSNAYTFLLGPVISHKVSPRVTPFVHALFGWDDWRWNASTPKGLSTLSATPAVTNSAFAIALGGGVDLSLMKHVSLRVGQGDYIHTTHNMRLLYGELFGPGNFQDLQLRQKNFRLATGIVFRF